MPFRKIKAKKYTGIYEYYRKSDPDKATAAYYIAYRDGDKVVKVKTSATNKDDALVKLTQAKASVRKHSLSNRSLPLNKQFKYSQMAEEFFKKRKTLHNQKDYAQYLKYIEPILGNYKVNNLSKKHFVHLQDFLLQVRIPTSTRKDASLAPLANKSINLITDLAYRVVQWGFEQEYMQKIAPINKLNIDNARQRILSENELEKLFVSIEGRNYIFVKMMYYTGLRPESILKLQRKHIMENAIVIDAIKGQKTHIVHISRKLQDILFPWVESLDLEDYIISRKKEPTPYKTIANAMQKVFKKLFNKGLTYKEDIKIWVSLYTLRHSTLTHLYERTGDIYLIQSIANHSTVQMTQRYAKHSEKRKKDAMDFL